MCKVICACVLYKTVLLLSTRTTSFTALVRMLNQLMQKKKPCPFYKLAVAIWQRPVKNIFFFPLENWLVPIFLGFKTQKLGKFWRNQDGWQAWKRWWCIELNQRHYFFSSRCGFWPKPMSHLKLSSQNPKQYLLKSRFFFYVNLYLSVS